MTNDFRNHPKRYGKNPQGVEYICVYHCLSQVVRATPSDAGPTTNRTSSGGPCPLSDLPGEAPLGDGY